MSEATLIRGGTVVNADGSQRADVLVVGERIAAAPVPLRSKLLVRGVDHLFCLGAK